MQPRLTVVILPREPQRVLDLLDEQGQFAKRALDRVPHHTLIPIGHAPRRAKVIPAIEKGDEEKG
jgi:hypothetical protein